jgi:hypothetical protein
MNAGGEKMEDAEAHGDTYRLEAVLAVDGTLTLTDLPFQAGDVVDVIIVQRPRPPARQERYPLHGTPIRYGRPTDPVAEEDWEAQAETVPPLGATPGADRAWDALDRLDARAIHGLRIPDEALRREHLYEDRM